MELQKLSINFKVLDDLTSERRQEYTDLVQEALAYYCCNVNLSEKDEDMVNHLMNDWEKA